eukprot:Nitzschia sp. Nitz4//scaffold160_size51814//20457//20678//NITZ4_006909-RA/size51814-processed-gene-0.52-mRNA-1//1//CDS//3329537842//1983//frame0
MSNSLEEPWILVDYHQEVLRIWPDAFEAPVSCEEASSSSSSSSSMVGTTSPPVGVNAKPQEAIKGALAPPSSP